MGKGSGRAKKQLPKAARAAGPPASLAKRKDAVPKRKSASGVGKKHERAALQSKLDQCSDRLQQAFVTRTADEAQQEKRAKRKQKAHEAQLHQQRSQEQKTNADLDTLLDGFGPL